MNTKIIVILYTFKTNVMIQSQAPAPPSHMQMDGITITLAGTGFNSSHLPAKLTRFSWPFSVFSRDKCPNSTLEQVTYKGILTPFMFFLSYSTS